MQLLVSNIQRFSMHDGPGIRTTVFLKGCLLHCPWCANPENISFEDEIYVDGGLEKHWAQYYSEDELLEYIKMDYNYYNDEGGVTFSGGEPLLQLYRCEGLFNGLKDNRIGICVETSLFVDEDKLIKVLPFIDYLYVDIKMLNPDLCFDVLGQDINLYKSNLNILKQYYHNPIVFRLPIIKEYTMNIEHYNMVIETVKDFDNISIQLFSLHNLARRKYDLLNVRFHEFQNVEFYELQRAKELFEKDLNCTVTILSA